MGYYINLSGVSKGTFLAVHGDSISLSQARIHNAGDGNKFVVCHVDNGWMTAAGIAYDNNERDVFVREDGRPKTWWLIERRWLKPHCGVL